MRDQHLAPLEKRTYVGQCCMKRNNHGWREILFSFHSLELEIADWTNQIVWNTVFQEKTFSFTRDCAVDWWLSTGMGGMWGVFSVAVPHMCVLIMGEDRSPAGTFPSWM